MSFLSLIFLSLFIKFYIILTTTLLFTLNLFLLLPLLLIYFINIYLLKKLFYKNISIKSLNTNIIVRSVMFYFKFMFKLPVFIFQRFWESKSKVRVYYVLRCLYYNNLFFIFYILFRFDY